MQKTCAGIEVIMKTIRWGIIGAGRISTIFATALNSMENTKIVAIAARDLLRAKDFARSFKIEKSYGSYEELVKDPEVDVVYIGTPHTEHKTNAALCLENGKAVLCEKPFTLNQNETEYLITLAKEKKLFLMEAMWTKFLPVTKVVKQWMQEKRIGAIKHFKITFGYHNDFDIANRVFDPDTAGGALLDVGIYPITYVVHLMDRLPDEVTSSVIIGKSNVDEQNIILFQYNQEGILANLSSAISAEIGSDAYIIGDKGKIRVPNFWKAERAELYEVDGTLIESYIEPFAINGYEYEAEEVNQCLRDEKLESDINSLEDTLSIIKVMDEIRAQWGLVYPQERK